LDHLGLLRETFTFTLHFIKIKDQQNKKRKDKRMAEMYDSIKTFQVQSIQKYSQSNPFFEEIQ